MIPRPASQVVPNGTPQSQDVPIGTMAVLMASVFTVSMGFGVLLPMLPSLIERLLGPGASAAQVARSTGLLTGLYTLSLFLFAPLWGHLSDRFGRRGILLLGLVGFSATMLTFSLVESLVAVYAERLLSGLFAAAVTPVALAAVSDLATTAETRARRLTFVSLSGISGFLLGPMFGVVIARGIPGGLMAADAAVSLALPLMVTGLLALVVSAAVLITVPGGRAGADGSLEQRAGASAGRWMVPKLLALAFIVAAGVGVFEVGLALRGKQDLGLSQVQIALMFTECSLVMIVVQAVVFSPWIRPESTRWFIAPALVGLAVGLVLVPRVADFATMLIVIGAVAASAGILSPILTYWISAKAGRAQGAQLGKQTAASSLGAAVGSAAGGLLYSGSSVAGASFLLVAALSAAGALWSVSLPRSLMATR